jgi:succinate dehydrogenase / fumarate reductase cytochrome b subunit
MIQIKKAITSSVGQKFLMALSGLGLILFAIIHLLGNLSLYMRDGTKFNIYANTLESFGALLTVAEIGLLTVFLLHIVTAIWISKGNKAARPIGYQVWRSKSKNNPLNKEAKPSNIGSRNMIISGLILLGFLILHIYQFRFGPDIAQGYVTNIHGQPMRDLHRLVVEVFTNPIFVGIYVISVLLLGVHLRHGIWSTMQSLGIMRARFSRQIHFLSLLIALILCIGFLFIPIWMHFGLSDALSAHVSGGSLQ